MTTHTHSLGKVHPRGFARGIVSGLVALVLTAACGQKPGVYVAGAPEVAGGLGSGAGSSYVIDPETGEIVPLASGASAPTSGSAVAGAGVPVAAVGNGSGTTSDPADPALTSTPPDGGSAVGITDETIKIGIHLPITQGGVPPFAPDSFKRYFTYLADKGDLIAGRTVELVWMDDRYEAAHARQVCKEMVEGLKVFMLVGYAGPHTMRACARYAESVGVPYVAPGSTEHFMAGLDTHFALTMTYARQIPILAGLMLDRLAARTKKNALVRVEGPDPPPPYLSPAEELEARGVRLEVEHLMTTQPNFPEIQTIVTDLKQRGIDNVAFGGSPTHFIYFSQAAGQQGFRPRIVAPAPSIAFDTFLAPACAEGRVAHGAWALHINPAFVDRRRFDREFDRATPPTRNEIDWIFWGLAKPIVELLRLPGRELTRERFLWYTARARNIETGVFPPISFSTEDHFAGKSLHLLRANCDDNQWHTQEAFFKG